MSTNIEEKVANFETRSAAIDRRRFLTGFGLASGTLFSSPAMAKIAGPTEATGNRTG
jgi:hypothetical protein